MLTPLYITGLIRADLLRARSMAGALTRNLGQVLDYADRTLPFALTRLEALLADDIIRLSACLQAAFDLHHRLSDSQITGMALTGNPVSELSTASLPPLLISSALAQEAA